MGRKESADASGKKSLLLMSASKLTSKQHQDFGKPEISQFLIANSHKRLDMCYPQPGRFVLQILHLTSLWGHWAAKIRGGCFQICVVPKLIPRLVAWHVDRKMISDYRDLSLTNRCFSIFDCADKLHSMLLNTGNLLVLNVSSMVVKAYPFSAPDGTWGSHTDHCSRTRCGTNVTAVARKRL